MSDLKPNQIMESVEMLNEYVFYFSHIPKTGGTSFTAILDRFFNQKDIFEPQLWGDVGDVAQVRKKGYRCIRGHFGMGAQVLSEQKLNTLTLLRCPLKLAHSTYQYIKREPNTTVYRYVTENNLSFEDFLQDENTRNLSRNRLIKSLSFGMGMSDMQQQLVLTPTNFKQQRKMLNSTAKSMSIEALFDDLKKYIDDCFWVGLLEDFEFSLMLLCHQMSWPVIGVTEKLNTHPRESEITEKAESLVRETNEYDFELYAYAKSVYERKKRKIFGDMGFNAEYIPEIAKTVDTHYKNNHPKKIGSALPNALNYHFSMPLLGQNWHTREWSDSAGIYFRWTGPEPVTVIDFWLRPQDYQIKLVYINVINDEILRSLQITINGRLTSVVVKASGQSGVICFTCDGAWLMSNGLLRIEMSTKALPTHSSQFKTEDNRRVGIAVKSIKIQKLEQADS